MHTYLSSSSLNKANNNKCRQQTKNNKYKTTTTATTRKTTLNLLSKDDNLDLSTYILKMSNVLWSENYIFYGLCNVFLCFLFYVFECWRMYLCQLNFECVRIHTSNCAYIGVLTFLAVLAMCVIWLITSYSQQETERLHRPRQRQPLKNG